MSVRALRIGIGLLVAIVLAALGVEQVSGQNFAFDARAQSGSVIRLTAVFEGSAASVPVLRLEDGSGKIWGPIKAWTKSTGAYIWAVYLVPLSTEILPGTGIIRFATAAGTAWPPQDIYIDSRNYYSESLKMDREASDLKTIPDPQKTLESQVLWGIISRFGTMPPNFGDFTFPLSVLRHTAYYGDRRVYLYSDGTHETGIHAGLDLGGAGNIVRAPGPGKVVFAARRILTGNTVILSHGLGLFSLYYHMREIDVTPGQELRYGDKIGETGATGFVTGPHLHWELRVSTEAVDAENLILLPPIDSGRVSSVLLPSISP